MADGLLVGFLPIVELGDAFAPFSLFLQHFGFVPNLFRAQSLLPRLIEAEAGIAGAVLLEERALTRVEKERIVMTVAAANANPYCVAAHRHALRRLGEPDDKIDRILADHRRADLPARDTAVLDFALKLDLRPAEVGRQDVDALRRAGCSDELILETVLTTGLTRFLCTLSTGLGAVPDFAAGELPPPPRRRPDADAAADGREPHYDQAGPYLAAEERRPEDFPPFAFFERAFGFVPNIFRAQTLRPDVLHAEAKVVERILLTEDVLTRKQKEFILLVVSAANLNTYCVAVHCEMLRGLGVPEALSDQIALDHRQAGLSAADSALLDFALALSQRPAEFGRADVDRLAGHGFSDAQILEAVAMTALTGYLNTVQMGLGTVPDFAPRPGMNPLAAAGDRMDRTQPPTASPAPDPDAGLVARAQAGDLEAFEELVRRHGPALLRLLVAVTGNLEDAEDAVQTALLKAYRHLRQFRGASRFSTWLTRIALNEGSQRRHRRRPEERFDGTGDEPGGDFQPRLVVPWSDDPERHFARVELRELVEGALMGMPPMYRTAVILRDLQGLTTAEAAEVLGLPIPTLKTRLHRGRLMLREALAPHFATRSRA